MLRITKVFSFLCLASVVTVASVDAQTPVPAPVASPAPAVAPVVGVAQAQNCGGGCTTNLGDCGQSGALFNRRANNGCGDCGSAGCGGGCGIGGGRMGSGGSGALMDRVKNFILPSDGCGGRYRSIFGGWSDMQDYNGVDSFTGDPVGGTFNDGFILGTARGRYINEHLRVEWESNWRNNSGEDVVTDLGTGPLDGQFNMFSSLINTVREFGCGRVRPYIGGGIGLGIQDGEFFVDDDVIRLDDWTFAYQGIIGLNMLQSDRTDFYCEYRYYGNANTGIEFNGTEFDDQFGFQSENIVFGFRIKR